MEGHLEADNIPHQAVRLPQEVVTALDQDMGRVLLPLPSINPDIQALYLPPEPLQVPIPGRHNPSPLFFSLYTGLNRATDSGTGSHQSMPTDLGRSQRLNFSKHL